MAIEDAIHKEIIANGFKWVEGPNAYYKDINDGSTLRVRPVDTQAGKQFEVILWEDPGFLIQKRILNANRWLHLKALRRFITQQ